MIGIEVTIPSISSGVLLSIIRGILPDKYNWFVYEDEIICKNKKFIIPPPLKGGEFFCTLSLENMLIIFANIQAYPLGKYPKKMQTYRDFIHSDCEIAILISDNKLMEIYSKDNMLIQKCLKQALSLGYKTKVKNEQDDRATMSVL